MRFGTATIKILYKPMIVLGALACLLLASAFVARAEDKVKVEAKFLYDLSGSDEDAKLNEPRDVFADPNTGEIFVADSSNDRIRIYNDAGMQLFEFGNMKTLRRPKSVVVNSKGNIYALHSNGGDNVISIFNFRGVSLGQMSFQDLPLDEVVVKPSALSIDMQDNIYVVDDQETIKRILVFNTESQFVRAFRIMAELDAKHTRESFAGKPFVAPEGNLYIPNPVIGLVYVYSHQGEYIRTIGEKGGGSPGTLNFPVDVASDSLGRVLVLDKTVSDVRVFDQDGTYLGSFGGRGGTFGSFIWPNSLDVDSKDRVYVSQVAGSRLQVMQLLGTKSAKGQVSVAEKEAKGGEGSTQRGPSDER